MNTKKRFLLIFLSVVMTLYFWSSDVKANSSSLNFVQDNQQIKKVINDYFEARYQSLSKLKPNDFSNLIIEPSNNGEMKKEMEKLALQIFHADVFQLSYQNYKFYLDFQETKLNSANDAAIVELTEGCDIVFEISAPEISRIRNIHHTINLQKDNRDWKILSDKYEDSLWKAWKLTNLSFDDFRNGIAESKKHLEDPQQIPVENLQNLKTTTYEIGTYNGLWAAIYADTYFENYNPDYVDFTGVDCTNFVSQAMYLGGGAPMEPTYWYYYDVNDRGPAWTGVPQLNYFLVVNKSQYNNGPSGVYRQSASNLWYGDIIQYDWTNNNEWDHSVIVSTPQSGTGTTLIDSHDADLNDVPYTYLMYYYPSQAIRYIHIEYIKYQ